MINSIEKVIIQITMLDGILWIFKCLKEEKAFDAVMHFASRNVGGHGKGEKREKGNHLVGF